MSEKISEEMLAFSAQLLRDRDATPRTKRASRSFVDRMTSSAADPKAAQAEGPGDMPEKKD